MVLTTSLRYCGSRLTTVIRSQSVYGQREVCGMRGIHRKSIYETKEAKKIRFYVLDRFMQYLKNYDKVLEKNFPATMQTYRVFTDGIRYFIKDTKEYFRIVHLLYSNSGNNFPKLLRREIELYHEMPQDMRKVAPILLFSALPFALYFTLPLIYTFPKQLLSYHFWTIEQREKFHLEYLRKRLIHNRPAFRHLQSQLGFLRKQKHPLFEAWSEVLGVVGSGRQPTVEQILTCRELFRGEPYHLLYLSRNHVKHLLKIHDLHAGWFRRTRLAEKAAILIEMDRAIMREGGVHNLPLDALKKSCYIRGLNPANMKQEEMILWLQNWIKISKEIDHESHSLLLHCSVLLGYNEPSNWQLIYNTK